MVEPQVLKDSFFIKIPENNVDRIKLNNKIINDVLKWLRDIRYKYLRNMVIVNNGKTIKCFLRKKQIFYFYINITEKGIDKSLNDKLLRKMLVKIKNENYGNKQNIIRGRIPDTKNNT